MEVTPGVIIEIDQKTAVFILRIVIVIDIYPVMIRQGLMRFHPVGHHRMRAGVLRVLADQHQYAVIPFFADQHLLNLEQRLGRRGLPGFPVVGAVGRAPLVKE